MSEIRKYLEDYHSGRIKMGLGIGVPALDDHIRFKYGQFVIINGLDNVGKTVWILWYFLCLSVKHNLKWCIWSGENKSGMLVRQLIEMYVGKKIKELTMSEVYLHEGQISEWFKFIPNDRMYKSKDLHKIAKEYDVNGLLIDPFTGLDREYTPAANYDFLNETREFCNQNNIATYVNTHPNTEAARRIYGDRHELAGYPMPPSRSQSEGGQPFANRPDDFITIHRIVGHPEHTYETLIYVRKVKDTETGGKVNSIEDPIRFNWNNGLGFINNYINPLNEVIEPSSTPELKPINPHGNWMEEKTNEKDPF